MSARYSEGYDWYTSAAPDPDRDYYQQTATPADYHPYYQYGFWDAALDPYQAAYGAGEQASLAGYATAQQAYDQQHLVPRATSVAPSVVGDAGEGAALMPRESHKEGGGPSHYILFSVIICLMVTALATLMFLGGLFTKYRPTKEDETDDYNIGGTSGPSSSSAPPPGSASDTPEDLDTTSEVETSGIAGNVVGQSPTPR